MPVLPVVHAVADPQFALDFFCPHFLVQIDRQVHQPVVIPAVEEPFDGTQLLDGSLVGVVYKIQGGMLPDRLLDQVQFIVRLSGVLEGMVEPGAHRIAAGKHLGVTLGIDGAPAAAHGQAHDGPVPFVRDTAVFLFCRRDQFLEEEVLVVPSGHVEVTVPVVVGVRMTGIRHDDDHLRRFSRPDQFVQHQFHPAFILPVLVCPIQAVQQIDDRVLFAGFFETVRKVNIVLDFGSEDAAVQAVRDNGAASECRYGQQYK